LPVSDVIWKHTPHMKFLQFPWRWLVALSFVACVLASMTLDKIRANVRASWFLLLIIAAMAVGGGLLFFQPCDDEDAVSAQVAGFRTGQGTQGTDEYTPVGADGAAIQQELPLVRVLRAPQDDTAGSSLGPNPDWKAGDPGSITARVDAQQWNAEHWLIHVVTPEAGYAVLRLMEYPSWRVTVDGKPAQDRPGRDDGLMAVPVLAGSHAIEVQWSASRDVIDGRAFSTIALLALAVVAMLERRERRV
jgi:hypothetical protein